MLVHSRHIPCSYPDFKDTMATMMVADAEAVRAIALVCLELLEAKSHLENVASRLTSAGNNAAAMALLNSVASLKNETEFLKKIADILRVES